VVASGLPLAVLEVQAVVEAVSQAGVWGHQDKATVEVQGGSTTVVVVEVLVLQGQMVMHHQTRLGALVALAQHRQLLGHQLLEQAVVGAAEVIVEGLLLVVQEEGAQVTAIRQMLGTQLLVLLIPVVVEEARIITEAMAGQG